MTNILKERNSIKNRLESPIKRENKITDFSTLQKKTLNFQTPSRSATKTKKKKSRRLKIAGSEIVSPNYLKKANTGNKPVGTLVTVDFNSLIYQNEQQNTINKIEEEKQEEKEEEKKEEKEKENEELQKNKQKTNKKHKKKIQTPKKMFRSRSFENKINIFKNFKNGSANKNKKNKSGKEKKTMPRSFSSSDIKSCKLSKKKFQRPWEIKISPFLFIELMAEEKLELFSFISKRIWDIPKIDLLINNIFNIFAYKKMIIQILKYHLTKQIEQTHSSKNLFRNNTISTKLLGEFGRFYGLKYFIQILKPAILDLIGDYTNMEIDPVLLENKNQLEDLNFNQRKLLVKSKELIDRIFQSYEKCPEEIKEICWFIRKQTKQKFPQMELKSVGAYYFLRLLCPILTFPDLYGVVDYKINKEQQRSIILITKIIQVISNRTTFSTNSYMSTCNDFVTQMTAPMFIFLDKLSNQSFLSSIQQKDPSISQKDALDCSTFIMNYLPNNLPEIQSVFKNVRDNILLKQDLICKN
ncbi:ras gtpase-activating protein [Anaeramoeba flamelloides]|uniref:Ras gtpase-activating protein n=1 Tax=Anaeramoeba flamelloides TaxID=1746091 RepID=A0ABQ8ZA85_9EUKA|nr:ras gtpase-activating protein [Anaeramoeba flamelloides]